MVIIVLVLASINPWTYLEVREALGPCPSMVTWALENKLYSCLMVFFLANMLETQLISTGAFEVVLSGETIWSKLETGMVPQPGELLNILDQKLGQGAEGRLSDGEYEEAF